MVLDGTGSVYDDTGWYLVSISWYCLLLGGTWSAKGLYACIYWKKWRFGQVTPMPHTQTSEYRATQLLSSIKHKLSHAMIEGGMRIVVGEQKSGVDIKQALCLSHYSTFKK